MKLFSMCMMCLQELVPPSFEPIISDYFEEPISYVTCNNGHKSILLLQNHKFEILLESAANALLDGYTLEAASTLSAAYERFFEFVIKVLIERHNIDDVAFTNTFKQIARQSERQTGGFLFLYLLSFKKNYQINKKIVEFRNKVIHSGYIPKNDEVLDFADLIYNEMSHISLLLMENYPMEIRSVGIKEMKICIEKKPEGMPIATINNAAFSPLESSDEKLTFRATLERYKEYKKLLETALPYLNELNKLIKKI